jgi:hypothetical protein
MTDKIPDGIIRAYRKALRAMAECNALNINACEPISWIYGVIWELRQLYPDLENLPEEE